MTGLLWLALAVIVLALTEDGGWLLIGLIAWCIVLAWRAGVWLVHAGTLGLAILRRTPRRSAP